MNRIPAWDLGDLFSSIDDPRIETLFAELLERAEKFHKKYHSKIEKITSAKKLKEALVEYESIFNAAIKPQAYGYLAFSAASDDPRNGFFLQKARRMFAEVTSKLVFFDLEVSRIKPADFKKILKGPLLADYRHFLEKVYAWRNHKLSENEEIILQKKHLTGMAAFGQLFEQEHANKKYLFNEKRRTYLGEPELLSMLYSENKQKKRKQAAVSLTRGLRESSRLFSFIFNVMVEDKAMDDALKNFEFPEQSRYLENESSRKEVDCLLNTVTENYALVQEYYRFKKKVLGSDKLFDYDRYAPVDGKERTYSFEEAKKIVLDAFGAFDERFADTAKKFFDNGWIDAGVRSGKQGGAFCMYVTPDKHPYVFVNFNGTSNDVMTLAHELGHGVHAYLARKQSFLNFDWPLTVAETASIFGEILTFDYLQKNEKNQRARLALYMRRIEGMIASVFRQVSMFKFEQDMHEAFRKGEQLDAKKLDAIWRKRQTEMFKNSVSMTEDYDCWWEYIPHFIHTPFYVYAYAFGELLALSLFEVYEKKGSSVVEKYVDMLAAGGSQSPHELVSAFGMDLGSEKFWQEGMGYIEGLLKEAKRIQSGLQK
ncbi:MAG TPA: M3 family oligoendopeptidase [Patescibacteria group bacterium]